MSDGPSRWNNVEAILAPRSLDQFLSQSYGRSPLHLNGAAGRFRHLFDWDSLVRLLETCPLERPRLKIVKAGKTIPPDRYLRYFGGMAQLDSGALSLLFDSGATAIINSIDDLVPAIAVVADEFGEALGGRPGVNLYANWRSEHGFDAHADFHEVLVLQLAGRKQWSIYKPTRTDPLSGDAFEAPPSEAAPHSVEMLEDGDLLYLPRGWIHAPMPAGEPSLHLTISITHPTGVGFMRWLAKELESDPEVRAAIPAAQGDGAMAQWNAGMAAIVNRALDGKAVQRYLADKEARRSARPRFSFPDFGRIPQSEWTAATKLRLSSPHRLIVETSEAGGAHLIAVGRPWPCSAAVGALLASLRSTKAATLESLEEGLGERDVTQLREMLGLLAKFGLLAAEQA